MKDTGVRIATVGLAFYLVAAASTVEAAKGVKKAVGANGHRTLTGIVQSITPNQTGYGTFQLRSASLHKKTGVNNAAGVKASNGVHELTVSSTTRFQFYNGTMAPLTALQRGQHVRVRAAGQQVEAVQIMNHQRSMGSFTRHRTMSYHPHMYHAPHHHR